MSADAALQKRLDELARRAAHAGMPCYTRFLEPPAFDTARGAANRAGAHVAFFGGYEGAERQVAAFYADDPPEPADYPIAALRITWNAKFAHPAHRDLLGAVMGLGIERETTGDIVAGEYRGAECAYLFAAGEMAAYIAASLESAGRASVKVAVADEEPQLKPPEGQALRATVQNARLDAVLAAGFRLSRGEAQRLVSAGLVKLNHAPTLRADAKLSEGDLISARGCGRLKVEAFQGESRRGRLVVALRLWGAK